MSSRKGNLFYPFHYLIQQWKLICFAFMLVALAFVINQFKISQYFPIKKVKIYGVKSTNQYEVKEVIQPLVKNGFFGINIEYIRDHLLQMPWISEIYVRRAWPDQLDIVILEKHAIAHWNNQHLLSEAGQVFLPNKQINAGDLPQFIGPEGQQMVMLQYFAEINRVLTPLHVRIAILELTSYSTWKLKLDNGITLQIGHKDILTRLNHFVKVYPKIIGQHTTDVDYIDLRYSNGIAVKWKARKDLSV
jgi:cell division protein FtsQ